MSKTPFLWKADRAVPLTAPSAPNSVLSPTTSQPKPMGYLAYVDSAR